MLPNPQTYFTDLTDPRRETKNKLHSLNDIVMIVLCSVLSGVEDGVGMEDYLLSKKKLGCATTRPHFVAIANGDGGWRCARNSMTARLCGQCAGKCRSPGIAGSGKVLPYTIVRGSRNIHV